jgi:hypothetical protein
MSMERRTCNRWSAEVDRMKSDGMRLLAEATSDLEA